MDLKGPVPYWFVCTSSFLCKESSIESAVVSFSSPLPSLCISNSKEFLDIWDNLHEVWSSNFEVYTDSSLKNAGSAGIMCGAAAYFLALDISVGIGVWDLLSSMMAELQTVVLALECVPSFCGVDMERRHIYNLVWDKDLNVHWIKIKSHSGVASNIKADTLAGKAAGSLVFLPIRVQKYFLMTEGLAVSGNTCHFVQDVFRSVCRAHWEVSPGCNMISGVSVSNVDWVFTSKVWHPNSYMLVGFTSWKLATLHMYIIKAVHHRLSVAVHKKLYDKKYFGVLYLLCDKIELLDHDFVLKKWCEEAIGVFDGKDKAINFVVDLVGRLVKLHYFKV
ncbi:hypothetical protein G9A89_008834 [Geosiphon pyriformis]|nr:hypothetical protein G9A89_008834 [Geosiphon pyriformis]